MDWEACGGSSPPAPKRRCLGTAALPEVPCKPYDVPRCVRRGVPLPQPPHGWAPRPTAARSAQQLERCVESGALEACGAAPGSGFSAAAASATALELLGSLVPDLPAGHAERAALLEALAFQQAQQVLAKLQPEVPQDAHDGSLASEVAAALAAAVPQALAAVATEDVGVQCEEKSSAAAAAPAPASQRVGHCSDEEEEQSPQLRSVRVGTGLWHSAGGSRGGGTPPNVLSPAPLGIHSLGSSIQRQHSFTSQRRHRPYARLTVLGPDAAGTAAPSPVPLLVRSVYLGRVPPAQRCLSAIDIAELSAHPQRISRKHVKLTVDLAGTIHVLPLAASSIELQKGGGEVVGIAGDREAVAVRERTLVTINDLTLVILPLIRS